jgi:hypothetical protein
MSCSMGYAEVLNHGVSVEGLRGLECGGGKERQRSSTPAVMRGRALPRQPRGTATTRVEGARQAFGVRT